MSLTPRERQLEKVVRKEHPGLLDGLPAERKKTILQVLGTQVPVSQIIQQTQVTATSSPVPPAELLMGYNSAFPDGAQRLFAMVERQSAHRIATEEKVTSGQLELSKRGQVFAFLIAAIFGAFGLWVTLGGHPVVGGTIFGTTVISLTVVFITGQAQQKRNLDAKAPK